MAIFNGSASHQHTFSQPLPTGSTPLDVLPWTVPWSWRMKQPYSAASTSALTVLHELLAAPPRESEGQIYVKNINTTTLSCSSECSYPTQVPMLCIPESTTV